MPQSILEIRMPVTPWKTPASQVERLAELGAPAMIVEAARHKEYSRVEKLRAVIWANSRLWWVEWATRLEGETEYRYLAYRDAMPRYVFNALDDLVKLGIIEGYTRATLPDGRARRETEAV